MTQMHFIAGLPRSGSTLLAAILRQNPAITASMSSPVGGWLNGIQKLVSGSNETSIFVNDTQRECFLRSAFISYYGSPVSSSRPPGPPLILDQYGDYRDCGDIDDYGQPIETSSQHIIFDTNRMWPSKLTTLVKLFPDCRVICCVRRVAWIMDSIERLVRKNVFELSGIFGFEPGGTVYSRVAGLSSSNGLVGFALDAMREGFYGEHANRMLVVEYEALAKNPEDTLRAIYRWLDLPYYAGHDYEHVEQIPGAAEFDGKLGTPGLHSVRGRVEWQGRKTVLPPELFSSFAEPPFWVANNPNGVTRIHCESPPERPAEKVTPIRNRVGE